MKIDSSTDFSKLRVGQLKLLLESKGVVCKDCVEKADYVSKIREVYSVQ